MNATIAVLPGDGIGPEVIESTLLVLDEVRSLFGHSFHTTEYLIGGASIDSSGVPLTDETLSACKASDAVLLGAVGGPKWDDPSASVRPEQGLLALRKGLKVFANLRPVKPFSVLLDASPIKPDRLRGVDLLVVRELTGGLYFGVPKGRDRVNGRLRAVDTMEYYEDEIRAILTLAFDLARKRTRRLASVDKANVLETSRLWRQLAVEIGASYPDVTLEHVLVDTAAMQLVSSPRKFDVIVTENMFGDILTDEAAVLSGSMGMLPSASLGIDTPGVYEPIHGSAPDIAGRGIANPCGAILSLAMMFRHSFNLEREARSIERAVDCSVTNTFRTADLGGRVGTRQLTERILSHLSTQTSEETVWAWNQRTSG